MKALMSLLALSLAVAFTAPAFAGDTPKTQADCAKMKDMVWDDATKTCVAPKK
jgi:hypothetical protein